MIFVMKMRSLFLAVQTECLNVIYCPHAMKSLLGSRNRRVVILLCMCTLPVPISNTYYTPIVQSIVYIKHCMSGGVCAPKFKNTSLSAVPWNRVLLAKLTVTALLKKFHTLTEPKGSSPYSQKFAT
jgi:hypothetical protein